MPDSPPPPPPTLAQLAAIFRASRNASISMKGEGSYVSWSIDISHAALAEGGYGFVASPEGIRKALSEALERLAAIDRAEAEYASRRPGASAADVIGFLRLELSQTRFNDLHSTLKRSMLEATIAHLQELIGRRAAADAGEQSERRAREAEAAAKRKAEEERMRAEQEAFRDHFYKSAYGSSGAESLFREFFAHSFWGGYGAGGSGRPPPRSSPNKRPWHEVLGISNSADKETIKAAAHRLRAKYHPDRCKDEDATSKISEVNVAFDEAMARF